MKTLYVADTSKRLECRFDYDDAIVGRFRALLSRGYLKKTKTWWVPYSCAHDLVELANDLGAEWNVVGIEHAAKHAALGYKLAFAPRAEKVNDLHPHVIEAWMKICDRLPEVTKRPSKPHQAAAIAWLWTAGSGLLGDDMGLGKTKISLDYGFLLMDRGRVSRIVASVPASIKTKWARELAKDSGIRVFLIKGTAAKRAALENEALAYERPCLVIYNHEQIWRSEHFLELCRSALLIGDEAHRLNNPKAKQSKAFKDGAEAAQHTVLLTGTPVVNGANNLWYLTQLISKGVLGWTNGRFEDRFGNVTTEAIWTKGSDGTPIERKVRRVKFGTGLHGIHKRAARCALRRTKNQGLIDLPEKAPLETREVVLSGEQETAYMEIAQDFTTSIDGMGVPLEAFFDRGVDFYLRREYGDVEAKAVIAQFLKLQQISDGFAFDTQGRPLYFKGGGGKLKELDTIVEEVVDGCGRPLVVWSRFKPPMFAIANRYKRLNPVMVHGGRTLDQRQEAVDALDNGRTKLFIGQVQTAGIGLDLFAASEQVFLSRWWSPAVNQQAEDRLHRLGQTRTVSTISLVAVPSERMKKAQLTTIDLQVEATLARKQTIADIATGDAAARAKEGSMCREAV